MNAIVEGGHVMSNEKDATWSFHFAVRQLSATATSLKLRWVREIDPKETERSTETLKTETAAGGPHSVGLTSSRREGGISDVASRAHISLHPILYFLPFSVLPCAFSRLPSRFPRSLLSPALSSLSQSALWLTLSFSRFASSFFILRRICPARFSVALRHPPRCVTVSLALQLLSSVLGMPSVLEPDGPIVPFSRLTSLLMAHRIEREVDPCCYAATAAEIRERSERERERKSVAAVPKRTGGERPLWLLFADRITSAARRRRGRVFHCCYLITFFLLPFATIMTLFYLS